MNKLLLILLSLIPILSYGQNYNVNSNWIQRQIEKNELGYQQRSLHMFFDKWDFSGVCVANSNCNLGFIGKSKRRLDVKVLSAVQNPLKKNQYYLKGQTIVGENIREFNGTITIKTILFNEQLILGVDDWMKDSLKYQGVAIGDYVFYENPKEHSTGVFSGEYLSKWFVDINDNIRCDNIDLDSDNYINNCYIGHWVSYKSTNKIITNWGSFRIPDSGDLDIGTAEFMPNPKYNKVGWADYKP